MSWKDVWKFVIMNNGELFVMMAGVLLMLEWSAHNLVIRTEVLIYVNENDKMLYKLYYLNTQVLYFSPMLSLGKELVLSSWIMLDVLELNQDSGIAQIMVLRFITVSIVRMLV